MQATMKLKRVEDKQEIFCVDDDLEKRRMMVMVDILVVIYFPRKQKEKEVFGCTQRNGGQRY